MQVIEYLAHIDFVILGSMRKNASLILLPLFSLLLACQPYENTTEQQVKGAIQDSLFRFTESTDLHVAMYDDGKQFLEISSNKAKTQQDNYSNFTVFTGNVSIILYDSTNTQVSKVTCTQATYDNLLETFTFRGAVKVISNEDKRLITEQLLWYREDRHIETESYVEIYTIDDSIFGYGLKSDEQLLNYNITDVSGKITIE